MKPFKNFTPSMGSRPSPARHFRAASFIAAGITLLASAALFFLRAGEAEPLPGPLRALQEQGVTIAGTFQSSGGLRAWAARAGDQPVALYLTPDGRHAVAGTMLDGEGKTVDRAALEKLLQNPIGEEAWKQLEGSRWIADGRDDAPRKVYVFTDPNCPYCNKLWADARPWIDNGQLQLRHVMVGMLTPTSAGKAAAILAADDPERALADHEGSHVAGTRLALARGMPRPLSGSGVEPLASIPDEVMRQLDENAAMMSRLGLQATPAVVWRDAEGVVQKRTGVPAEAMAEIFGPMRR